MDLSLHPKQSEAFLSTATEILYGGAAGGGKSHLMRVAAIAWCYAIPGLQVYLFRRVFDDLWKNHMEGSGSFPAILAAWVDAGWAKINHSDHKIVFWNGSTIHLCHLQHRKHLFKYQGAEIHLLLVDELTHFMADEYRFLRSRVRLGGLQIPDQYKGQFPRIICGANPGGVGHNWVKADWIDPEPEVKIWRAPKDEGGMLRQYIPAQLEDNPTIAVNDPDYEDRLHGLGDPELVKAMRWGIWDIVAGGMLDDVWDSDVHVLRPFTIPAGWRVDRSFDWGSSKPFAVGWWAEADGTSVELADGRTWAPPKGTVFRIAEWYGWNGKPNEGCKMLARDIAKGIKEREESMGLNVVPGPADSSIFDAENGSSIADDMAAEGITWEHADKSPGSRINGWEKLRGLLQAAKKRPMEEPGLFVFETCRHFIRTVPTLPRDDRKRDDVDTDAEDHIGDESRYRITAKQTYTVRRKTKGL